MFSNSDSGDANGPPGLPTGFIPSFVVIPLLTYGICLAVVWTLGFNDGEKEAAKRRADMLFDRTGMYALLRYMSRLRRALRRALSRALRKVKHAIDGLISGG